MTTATQSDVWTVTSYAILRCKAKGCRVAVRVSFDTTSTTVAYSGRMSTSRTVTYAGVTRAYRDRYDLAQLLLRLSPPAECGHIGRRFDIITGRFSESVKCGPACRNAVGPSCDCQCSGENHAANHAAH